MENAKVNFRLPADRLKAIDDEAEADHRDRTSMLHKIIAFYFDNHPHINGRSAAPPKKKAGSR
jgi:hypothetical protein